MNEKLIKINKKKLENYKNNKTSLGVEQIDKVTGKVLNIFKNRYQAASWIIDSNLTNYFYRSLGPTRAAIAGALTISMLKSGSAYGYDWKFTNSKPTKIYHRLPTIVKNRKRVIVSIYDKQWNRTDFTTIKEACDHVGVTRHRTDSLKAACKKAGMEVYIKK